MFAAQSNAKEFLSALPFFSGLPEADMRVISENADLRHYKKHQHIYYQGDEANRMIVVKSGWLRLYRTNIHGEETVAGLLTKGESLGERTMLPLNRKQTLSAQAVEECSTVEIAGTIIRERIDGNPEIMRRIAQMLMQKVSRLHVENEHLSHMDAPKRVACLLLRLSAKMQGTGATFTIPFDKALAAAQLGMKRETFSRALARLKPFGVHINGSEIKIESFTVLSTYACLQCSMDQDECEGRRCGTCSVGGCQERMKMPRDGMQLSLNFVHSRNSCAS